MSAQALSAVSANAAEWDVVAAPYPVAGDLREAGRLHLRAAEAGPAVAQLQVSGIRRAGDS